METKAEWETSPGQDTQSCNMNICEECYDIKRNRRY